MKLPYLGFLTLWSLFFQFLYYAQIGPIKYYSNSIFFFIISVALGHFIKTYFYGYSVNNRFMNDQTGFRTFSLNNVVNDIVFHQIPLLIFIIVHFVTKSQTFHPDPLIFAIVIIIIYTILFDMQDIYGLPLVTSSLIFTFSFLVSILTYLITAHQFLPIELQS